MSPWVPQEALGSPDLPDLRDLPNLPDLPVLPAVQVPDRIEPMLTLGGGTKSRMWRDGWTAVTADGRLTAQFEHTLLITRDGVEVLT